MSLSLHQPAALELSTVADKSVMADACAETRNTCNNPPPPHTSGPTLTVFTVFVVDKTNKTMVKKLYESAAMSARLKNTKRTQHPPLMLCQLMRDSLALGGWLRDNSSETF